MLSQTNTSQLAGLSVYESAVLDNWVQWPYTYPVNVSFACFLAGIKI